jgi:Ca-activated chloride channel family protein
MEAIDSLTTDGSTNVQAGLKIGYKMARKNFQEGWINRIVLCSDGVANNGITQADKIFASVKDEAKDGITISTVGFGMGNYNDVLMERLADIGDGNYAYVDRIEEAKKIFQEQLTGTLQVIAKDVKIQLEFDKKKVTRYRLLGFENRRLEKHQFDDDKIDAGEIGAGHTVTAMYEVKFTDAAKDGDFGTLRIRHKKPEGGSSTKIEKALPYAIVRADYAKASPPTKLSFVAAAFAEKLRGSYWVRNLEWNHIVGYWEDIPAPLRNRADVQELGDLIRKSRSLDQRGDKFEKDYGPVAEMDFDNVPVLK